MAEIPPSNAKPTAEGEPTSVSRRAKVWALCGGTGLLLGSLLVVFSPVDNVDSLKELDDVESVHLTGLRSGTSTP